MEQSIRKLLKKTKHDLYRMTLLESVLSQQTFAGILLAIALWSIAKVVDTVLGKLMNKRIFSSFYSRISKRWRIFQTRFDPIRAEFQFSYVLTGEVFNTEMSDDINSILDYCENLSENRVEFSELNVDDEGETLYASAEYIDDRGYYELEFSLISDVDAIRSNQYQSARDAPISEVGCTIDFEFPFNKLEASVINLSAFVRLIEKSFTHHLPGRASSGQFVIRPLENGLSLDDWIEEKRFNVSVLLRSEDRNASVEFFGNKAVIEAPYFEIDSETVDYIRATLLNYYL